MNWRLPSVTWLISFALADAGAGACHAGPAQLGPPDAVYHVRGQIVAAEGSGDDATVSLSHEAIPGFRDRDGKPGTMPAMTMFFALGPRLDGAALKPKSSWDVTFEVRWNGPPTLRIVAAKPLPAGTSLTLAAPPR